jgi:hypothetical protein
VLQLGIALRLLVTRETVQDECRELIITGGAPLGLPSVERERRRLADPRNRARVAGSIDAMIAMATGSDAMHPYLDLHLIRALGRELREVAALLRAESTDVVAVALTERLLNFAGSPLYRGPESALRAALARVRYLLLAASKRDCLRAGNPQPGCREPS